MQSKSVLEIITLLYLMMNLYSDYLAVIRVPTSTQWILFLYSFFFISFL